MSLISLLTDFGLKDGNVGVMKGIIASIAPQAQVIDLSHLIEAQNILEGALVLARSAPYFPPGAIHLAVVDPGVGTARRPLAAQLGEQFYVLPDNGLITLVLEQAESQGAPIKLVHLDRSQYWRREISHVFHGRDIFAPVAAHLAAGVPLEALGSPIRDPLRLAFPRPQPIPNGLQAVIIHVDHFGNLSSSIRRGDLTEHAALTIRLGGIEIRGLVETFGERPPGELVALYGSTGSLIVAQVNGSAARALGVGSGAPIEVTW